MNTVCLAQRHLIYSIVICNVLSQTESLSKEQKAIFFFQRKLLLDEDSHALNSVSNYLEKTLHQIYLFYLIRRN